MPNERPVSASAAVTVAQVAAVAVGASVGALLRWAAGLTLNSLWAGFPIGTLLVNCIGGLLIGVAMVWFSRSPDELLRLLLVGVPVGRNSAIAGRGLDFEFDQFIPHRIAAVTLGDGHQFTHAPARIESRRSPLPSTSRQKLWGAPRCWRNSRAIDRNPTWFKWAC